MVKRLAHWLRVLAGRLDPVVAVPVAAPAPPETVGMFLDGRVWTLPRAHAEALMQGVNSWNNQLAHMDAITCAPPPERIQ